MSILASTGTDAVVFMLCQMEYNATVHPRQYWQLTSWLADLTNAGDYPESDAMKVYHGAFMDPLHPQHGVAVKLDLYRKSVTDLLNTAAAQLTILYNEYPRYTRLALVRRLEQRFIGWHPVDSMRISALDSIDRREGGSKPIVVHHAELPKKKKMRKEELTEEELVKAQKEKHRKKALEKRKHQLRKSIESSEDNSQRYTLKGSRTTSDGPSKREDDPGSLGHSNWSSILPSTAGDDCTNYPWIEEVTKTPFFESSSQPATFPGPLKTRVEHDELRRRNDSCEQSTTTSCPRSSLASIWTLREQAASTSDTSSQSSEKVPLPSDISNPALAASARGGESSTAELFEVLLKTKPNEEVATTVKEEEMHAHIIRIAERKKDSEIATLMAKLLPKPRPMSKAARGEDNDRSINALTKQIVSNVPKGTKERRRLLMKSEEATTQRARELDLADYLLYSTPRKEVIPDVIMQEPMTDNIVSSSEHDLECELDTMPNVPTRGRTFNKSR